MKDERASLNLKLNLSLCGLNFAFQGRRKCGTDAAKEEKAFYSWAWLFGRNSTGRNPSRSNRSQKFY